MAAVLLAAARPARGGLPPLALARLALVAPRWYSAQPLGWLSQLAVLADEGAAADRLEQGPVVGDEDAPRPRTRVSASSSASRLSMSRWLVGSSRIRTLAPEATRIASESRRCSPPEMSASCFSTSRAGEEEAAEQVARLLPAEAGLALGGVEHGALAGRGLGVLGEVADLDVVAGADAAGGRLALPGEGLDQGRLAGAVGADEDDVLAALDFEVRRSSSRVRPGTSIRRR